MELENSKESIGKLLKSVNLASLLNNNVQKKSCILIGQQLENTI